MNIELHQALVEEKHSSDFIHHPLTIIKISVSIRNYLNNLTPNFLLRNDLIGAI